ncbi:hypothetical protein [Arthrobacter sp. E3]|uniref:hypothetical protein n=1 Tax=Arthrobacter sp. E3 TaxID=517402 RepID=UPI001A94A56C|nr:hypothetical protein [Arthrobacter sp. E3]
MKESIQLAILLGRGERADVAIDELWRNAQSAVAQWNVPVVCVAGYAQLPHANETLSHNSVKVVGLKIPAAGRLGVLVDTLAAKHGPVGIVGRLVQYNLASRRVARALNADGKLTDAFCNADVIVAADPEADRAVWGLRGKTEARLMHGPFAMANALTEVAKD